MRGSTSTEAISRRLAIERVTHEHAKTHPLAHVALTCPQVPAQPSRSCRRVHARPPCPCPRLVSTRTRCCTTTCAREAKPQLRAREGVYSCVCVYSSESGNRGCRRNHRAGATTGSVAQSQRRINQTRESAERRAKRERFEQQLASGSLVIRQASPAELRRFQQEREQRRDP